MSLISKEQLTLERASHEIISVDAQWITAKKDWQEAKRRYQDRGNTQRDEKHEPMLDQSESATYNQDMDTMRCILYAHGGK